MANENIKGPITLGCSTRYKRKVEFNKKSSYAYNALSRVCPNCSKCNNISGCDVSNQEVFFCLGCGYMEMKTIGRDMRSAVISRLAEATTELLNRKWIYLNKSSDRNACFDCGWKIQRLSWEDSERCINVNCKNN